MALGVTQLIGFGSGDTGSLATFTDCVNIISSGTNFAAGGGYAGYTIVSKFSTPILAAAGTICRITCYGPTSGQTFIGACWIGQSATSGSAYNFDGGQVQVKFGGSGARTLGTSEIVVSDDVAFSITQSRSILVAFQMPSASASNTWRKTSLGANYVAYEAASVQEAGTTTKSGTYGVASGVAYIPFRIEVA